MNLNMKSYKIKLLKLLFKQDVIYCKKYLTMPVKGKMKKVPLSKLIISFPNSETATVSSIPGVQPQG
jgi:hypothetical protein